MKKTLMLVLTAVLLAAALIGCAKPEETTEAPTTEAPTETPTEVPTYSSVITPEDYCYGLDENGYIIGFHAKEEFQFDIHSIQVDPSEFEPSEETIDNAIATLITYFPVEIRDRAIADGDYVSIDYSGKLDGVAFQGGTAEDALVEAGSADFVDDFLKKIIGRMPGETFDIEITFPDPYQPNNALSGKLTIFTITVNYIAEESEFTDEFVKENSAGIEELTGFKAENMAEVREGFRDYFLINSFQERVYEILGALEITTIPESVYDYMYHATDVMLRSSYGVSIEAAAMQSSMTEQDLKEYIETDCKPEMVFQAIAEQEGWTVSEEDYSEVTMTTDNEQFISMYGKAYIARAVLINRAILYLKENLFNQN
ncbi:MAG: FKBP-type peptidyl-prolyl cis-trans isomerase [Lachnospiraceae bacterium]|nr:FKBP-type peptidyl-prolyl cis-trans isomerase [Lachnospiraceae bacterium]